MPSQVLLKFDLLLLPCASHPGNLQSLACTAAARERFKSLLSWAMLGINVLVVLEGRYAAIAYLVTSLH